MKKIFILSLFVILISTACTLKTDEAQSISPEEAKAKATDFINNYLMGAGQTVSIKEVTEDGDLYKVVVKMPDGQNGQAGEEIDSFLSKDGTTFFPSAMNIEEVKQKKDEAGTSDKQAAAPEVDLSGISKKDKPEVELFVMSHCPFGTQMEKGLLPVLDILGDTIDFKLRFNDYAMHGEPELDEELSQYCVQKNNPELLPKYLKCFLADKDGGDACLDEIGINKAQHASCVASTDKEYKIKEQFKDKSTWRSGRFPVFPIFENDNRKYGVTGSPSLVVNGNKIGAARDSASLLKTICAGFANEPEECKTSLSASAPGPGFGFESSGTGADSSCGS